MIGMSTDPGSAVIASNAKINIAPPASKRLARTPIRTSPIQRPRLPRSVKRMHFFITFRTQHVLLSG